MEVLRLGKARGVRIGKGWSAMEGWVGRGRRDVAWMHDRGDSLGEGHL